MSFTLWPKKITYRRAASLRIAGHYVVQAETLPEILYTRQFLAHGLRLPSSCTAFSQAFTVNWFRWRISDERLGVGHTFRSGPRDPKRMTEV